LPIISLCNRGGNASVLTRSQKEGTEHTREAEGTVMLDSKRVGSTGFASSRSGLGWCTALTARVGDSAFASVLAADAAGSAIDAHGLELAVAGGLDVASGLDVERTGDISERGEVDGGEVSVDIKISTNGLQLGQTINLLEQSVVGDLQGLVDGGQGREGKVGQLGVVVYNERVADLGELGGSEVVEGVLAQDQRITQRRKFRDHNS